MFTRAERDELSAVIVNDPGYMIDLLESTTYDASIDVTPLRESRLIIEELSALAWDRMSEGTRARVGRWLNEGNGV